MTKEKEEKKASYDAKDIYVLEGLEPVRKRPGMYIGSTGVDGLHHLVWEVVDNSIDEAMAGHAKNVRVEILKNNRIVVVDDGRGIPVDIHPQTKKSALETVLCTLHAGGKFGGESYKVSGGLHGVGVSVVNALSEWLRIEVSRNNVVYVQEYERGKPKFNVKKVGASKHTGTKVIFDADPEIFQEIKYDRKKILDHLRQQAYLTKGVRISFVDTRDDAPFYYGFYFEGGLKSFIGYLIGDEPIIQDEPFYVHKNYENMDVEAVFVYTSDTESKELSFANNIHTPDGGMHLTGLRSAMTRSLNDFARKEGYLKEAEENLTGDDIREGLVSVVSVKIPEPQFEGQTKARLGNPEARTSVEMVVNEALKEFLERHGSDGRKIIEKNLLAAKARKAAKAAKDTVLRKGALEGLTLPGKLADCSSRKAEDSELFIVEGDSAGGCFFGKTEVALTDGRNLSFEKIVEENKRGKENFCYTIQKNGHIGIAPILNPRITKKNAEVIKIVLDNNEKLICTPDHKFMLVDGTFKEAQKLKKIDSLMPLYRQRSKIGERITIEGYEMVFDPLEKRWIFTHLLSDQYNLKKGIYNLDGKPHRHHKDFNKLNNNPENIIRLSKEEHLSIHKEMTHLTLQRPDVLKKLKIIRQKPEFREKISRVMLKKREEFSKFAQMQWQNNDLCKWRSEKTKEQWTPDFRMKRRVAYNETYREKAMRVMRALYDRTGAVSVEKYDEFRRQTKDKSILRFDTILNRFFGGKKERLIDAVVHYNHKIVRIEPMLKKVDVYDLEVPETHNFALASGIFVHNSAKQGRDRRFQAILPLRGKIMNVEKSRIDKMLLNKEIRSLVIALGTAISENFDIEKLRYHKVVIMTDADVDGAHIRTLLLTLFYRYFVKIVEGGYLYIAQPPLFHLQKGKETHYAYSDAERDKLHKQMGGEGVNVQRYKGLGEMNPSQLWETTMDPAKRILKRIDVEDAVAADKMFDVLMGELVEPRKNFIQAHALTVKNLDV